MAPLWSIQDGFNYVIPCVSINTAIRTFIQDLIGDDIMHSCNYSVSSRDLYQDGSMHTPLMLPLTFRKIQCSGLDTSAARSYANFLTDCTLWVGKRSNNLQIKLG